MRALYFFAAPALLLAITVFAAPTVGSNADPVFREIYTAEWTWRHEQIPDMDDPNQPILDHLPKVDPAVQAARLRYWERVIQQLREIARAELSPVEQTNYDIYLPQIEVLVE